jgi:hypothetical protein
VGTNRSRVVLGWNATGARRRYGATAALATDLPAAILADLLGMHINTAIRWVTYTRRDWADYLAARAAEPGNRRWDE